MTEINKDIGKAFGNRLRVRVCGICIEDDKILLAKHGSIGEGGFLWIPPGGGLDFGESMEECLIREFKEETSLDIKVGDFLFLHEYLKTPLHAIELFFMVSKIGGKPKLGSDPEIKHGQQIIQELRFIGFEEIRNNQVHFHQIFQKVRKPEDLLKLKGSKI